jgi:hypothetical protein
MFNTDLANRQTISTLVTAYQGASSKIQQAYRLLDEADRDLKLAFGKDSYFKVLPDHGYILDNAGDNVLRQLKRTAWCRLVDLTEVRKTLSIKRAAELDRSLQESELEEISVPAIVNVLQLYVENADAILHEAVAEIYDWLRPGECSGAAGYKTNQKNATFELGPKIILTWIVEHGYQQPFRVIYQRHAHLYALDKVFYALDSAGIPPGYKSPLIDAINTSPDGKGETTYFRFSAHKNGNLHLEFKRLDLVARLNQFAGGPNLKPAN